MKAAHTPKIILVALFALLFIGVSACWAIPVKALDNNDTGSAGSSGIIGLPSGGSFFQNTASQPQSGAANTSSGVAGASVLRDTNTDSIVVVGPAYSSDVAVEAPVTAKASIWWVIVMAIAALSSIVGITLMLFAKPQEPMQEMAVDDEPEQEPGEPIDKPEQTQKSKSSSIEVHELSGDDTETKPTEDSEKLAPKPAPKKKRDKHGRPAKKRRK